MNGGNAVADAVFPDEENASLTTVPGRMERTITVRKDGGKRDRINYPEERGEGGCLGHKRRKETQEPHATPMKLVDVQITSAESSGKNVPNIVNLSDDVVRLRRKIKKGEMKGLADSTLDGYVRIHA